MKATQAAASRASGHMTPRRPGTGRLTGAAGLLALTTLILGVVLGARPDIADQAALVAHLEADGNRLFLAWLVTTASGLAWLCFVVGLRRLLPGGGGRDLFALAAVAGQAALWIGAALNTATAPTGAHDVPLPVYTAFGEAAHLAQSAGMASTGLALVGLAAAMRRAAAGWPRFVAGLTLGSGMLLVLTAPIGPVSLPVLVLWTAAASITSFRMRGSTKVR